MLKKTLLLILVFLFACNDEGQRKDGLRNWVGDISKNKITDNKDFQICFAEEQIFQYFNFSKGPVYNGEKPRLVDIFKSKYKPIEGKDQDGFIRIRFVVNCKGDAGRFRIIQSDLDFENTEFDSKIITQLLDIIRDIKQWEILKRNGTPVDYYMYLIFKIEDGEISEILP